MKKTLINKKIIKALTIGLSLALSTESMTVMAAEDTTPITNNDNEEAVNSKMEEKTDEAYINIKKGEGEALEAIDQAQTVPSESVQETKEELEAEMDYNIERKIDAPEVDVRKAYGVSKNAEGFAIIAENKAESAELQADITKEKVEDATDLVNQAKDLTDKANKKVEDTEKILDASSSVLEKISNEVELNQIYSDASAAVSNMNKTVEETEKELNNIKEKFDKDKAAYNEAVSAYTSLKSQFENAQDNFELNKDVAGIQANEAEDRLEDLISKTADLETAARKAKEDYLASGMGYVQALENSIATKLNNNQSVNFTGKGSYAELFDSIVEFYYVPQMLEGEFVNIEWHRYSGNYTYADGTKSTQGDVLNYCTVTYLDKEGNTVQKNLNYKIANGNRTNDAKWPGIVIFEKTEHNALDNVELTTEELNTLNSTNSLEKNGIKYIKENNEYFKVAESGQEKVYFTEETTTTTQKNFIGEEKISYAFENGKLIKTVQRDVSTTTYTGASLSATSSYDDEEQAQTAYKQELQKKIDALGDNDFIIINNKEFKKGDIADLTGYESTSKTTYSISGTFSEKYTDTMNRYSDKYVFSNGTYLLGIGEQHDYDEIAHYAENNKVIVEYAKVTKTNSASYSWLHDAIIGCGDDKEKLEKSLTEKFAKEGKIYVGIDPTDWNIGSASVYIIDAKSLSIDVIADDEETAKNEFSIKATEKINPNAKLYNVKTSVNATTAYSFKTLNYLVKNVLIEKDKIVAQTIYNTDKVNLVKEYRNDNWYTGNIILLTQDKAEGMDYKTDGKQPYNKDSMISDNAETQATRNFRDAVEFASDLAQKYQDIADKAKAANEDFIKAKQNVKDLQIAISKMKANSSIDKDITDFGDLENQLKQALKDFEITKNKKDELNKKLADIKKTLDEKIKEINTVEIETSGDDIPATILPLADAPLTITGNNNPTVQENNGAERDNLNTNVDDNEIDNNNQQSEENPDDKRPSLTDIAQQTIALSDGIKENNETLSLWWILLIIILILAGGYGIHHYIKKEEKDKK